MSSNPVPEQKSLAYAEGLGLNSVYEESVAKSRALEAKNTELAALRSEKRRLEAFRADIEMEVAEDERGKHPDMSQAQMDKHLRIKYSNNSDIRETRDELSSLAGEIDFVEFQIEQLHTDIKIAVARLHELGGYFQFMAVIKQSSEARKSREANEASEAKQADGNPWK